MQSFKGARIDQIICASWSVHFLQDLLLNQVLVDKKLFMLKGLIDQWFPVLDGTILVEIPLAYTLTG